MMILLSAVLALAVGLILGYLIRQSIARRRAGSLEAKLGERLNQAKSEANDIILTAKDKAVKILEETKLEFKERQNQLARAEDRVIKKEDEFSRKNSDLEQERKALAQKIEQIKNIKQELDGFRAQQITQLEKTANLSRTDAKDELIKAVQNIKKSF